MRINLQERTEPTEQEQDQESNLKQNFKRIAGEDMEIDAYELQEILNSVFQRGGFPLNGQLSYWVCGGGGGACVCACVGI